MDSIILPSVMLGFLSSWITEIFKFIPWCAQTKFRKRLIALLISVIAMTLYAWNIGINFQDWFAGAILVIGSAFTTYKAVVKTVISEE